MEYAETFQGVKTSETGFRYLGAVMEGKLFLLLFFTTLTEWGLTRKKVSDL
jgi:hypothetical protein